MKFMREGAVALTLAIAMAGTSAAQTRIDEDNSGVGTTSAEFLLLGAGARGMALGSGYSAIVNDVEATYYNPAGLPLMDQPAAALTMMSYFADTDYLWAGLAMPLSNGEWGLGFSVQSFGFSNAPNTTEEDPLGESGLEYDVRETAFGLSFAHAFIDRFSGGITLKYITSELGQTSGEAFAVDVGTNFHTEWNGRPISMSFMLQNLGTPIEHTGAGLRQDVFPEPDDNNFPSTPLDPYAAEIQAAEWQLPVLFRVAVAHDVLSTDANRVSLIGQFTETNNNDAMVGFAGEYAWTPTDLPVGAALRGSYEFQPDNDWDGETSEELDEAYETDSSDSLDGLVLGGGLRYGLGDLTAGFDYAWRHFGVLGTRHVFTVSFGW